MRIVFVIASLNSGGAERVIANLANCFAAQKDEIELILFNDVRYYELDERVKVHIIKEEKRGVLYVLDASRRLRKELMRIDPEVVVSFLTEINVLSILASIGATWKLIVSERNNPYIMPRKKYYRWLRSVLYPFCDAFVFQTKQAQEYFVKSIQRRSRVIHNPIGHVEESHSSVNKKTFEIVSVGRLEPQKNFALLINTFKQFHDKYSNSTLTIYGEGHLRDDLENQIKSLSLEEAVTLPGNQKNVIELISDKSVFVLSSDYEGMSNALMEAMAVGLPCVSTDCPIGGSSELIQDHVNGLLVSVGNSEELLQALMELYEDHELRNKLGNKAREILSTHSPEKISLEWRRWIENINKGRNWNENTFE